MASRIAFILLAAGGSSRMGRPKQLLPYGGRSLLRHAAEAALATPCQPVIVVVGANAEAARTELEGLPVRVAENRNWAEGIGSSLRAGVAALDGLDSRNGSGREGIGAVLIGLCDQPRVGPAEFARLIDAYRSGGKGIVAASYGGGAGVPALFARKYFAELRRSGGGAGAKKLIERFAADAAFVAVPAAEEDVDTPEDYRRIEGSAGPSEPAE